MQGSVLQPGRLARFAFKTLNALLSLGRRIDRPANETFVQAP